MPKQVYQTSDGTVFNDFEEANKYEVQQEMDTFERLGLDAFLEQEHKKSQEQVNPSHYHGCRQFLSDLLLWCTRNDKVLTITGKNDVRRGLVWSTREAPPIDDRQAPPIDDPEYCGPRASDRTTGAERGPDISTPPGINPNKPVPYEPPPADFSQLCH